MTTEEKKNPVKEKNPQSDAANWDARVKKELEAPHLWNETWGTYFEPVVPTKNEKRIQFLEKELNSMEDVGRPIKYGVAPPFKEIIQKDYRRKKAAKLGGTLDD